MGLRHAVGTALGRFSPRTLEALRNLPTVNPSGLNTAGQHHRSYVGPPEDFDLIAGLSFSLLIDQGLRAHHKVADVGCGSLRVGRLLIPYLNRGNYYGLEPNRWLVRRGIRWEVGRSAVRLKQPQIAYRDDFDLSVFDTSFDFVLAQSVFSHTFPDLLGDALTTIRRHLGDGLLIGTFVEPSDDTIDMGTGWLYPECVGYGWGQFQSHAESAGMTVRLLDWPHPRQRWFSGVVRT